MIHLLAFITAKPGKRDAILREFTKIVPLVHVEKGCIEYGPVIDAAGAPAVQAKLGPDKFAVVEKWESIALLEAHMAAPHMAEYGAKTKDLIAERVLHILSPA